MKYSVIIPVIAAFAVSALLGQLLFRFYKNSNLANLFGRKGRRHIRKKSGTPTMGALFSLPTYWSSLLSILKIILESFQFYLPPLVFGLIGFLDDYIKVVKT